MGLFFHAPPDHSSYIDIGVGSLLLKSTAQALGRISCARDRWTAVATGQRPWAWTRGLQSSGVRFDVMSFEYARASTAIRPESTAKRSAGGIAW